MSDMPENKTRRTFLKTAAQVAVTAPAAVVLLNAATISPAAAQGYAGQPFGQDGQVVDDTGHALSCTPGGTGNGFGDFAGNNPLDCPQT